MASCLSRPLVPSARGSSGEDLAALFAGEPRGDQRTGPARSFYDDNAERQAGDEPVAARQVARAAPR
jgi:hypothetical protein